MINSVPYARLLAIALAAAIAAPVAAFAQEDGEPPDAAEVNPPQPGLSAIDRSSGPPLTDAGASQSASEDETVPPPAAAKVSGTATSNLAPPPAARRRTARRNPSLRVISGNEAALARFPVGTRAPEICLQQGEEMVVLGARGTGQSAIHGPGCTHAAAMQAGPGQRPTLIQILGGSAAALERYPPATPVANVCLGQGENLTVRILPGSQVVTLDRPGCTTAAQAGQRARIQPKAF